jgi:tetratricopeptide (TPR) repeat protein
MKAFNDATFAMFQRTPASYRVHLLSAEILEVQSRYSEAIPEYRKAIEMNATAPDLHYRLGRALLLQSHSAGALTEASDAFRAELAISPEDSASEFQLGQIALVQGNGEQARTHYETALRLTPRFASAAVALGKLYAQEKQYDRAIELLKQATNLQPENEAAHYALLTAYRNAGQMENARAEKAVLDKLQKPPEGEFSNFLKKLGDKPPEQ